VADDAAYADALASALEAERSKNWTQSHVLCEKALLVAPEDPDALNLLGRLSGIAGDGVRAIALQSFVLHLSPGHARAAIDLDRARRAIASAPQAQQLFEEAIRLAPDVACHQRYFQTLWPFAGMERVEELLRTCISLDPSHAGAHAAVGNLEARGQERFAAIESYGIATMLCWTFTEAHLALADLLDSVREEAIAARHRAEALAQQQLFAACGVSAHATRRVLVLAAPGGIIENAPLDFLVNPYRTALHRYFLVDGGPEHSGVPSHDVLYNGIEELESSAGAIAHATRYVDSATLPVVNHPRNVAKTRRNRLGESLAGIAGCVVPPTIRLDRAQLQERLASGAVLQFPLLIRPVDSHRGDGLERMSNDADVEDYLSREGAAAFTLSAFFDYRSPDGYFRKYRVIVVGGVPFPYHLAISDRWMVHYTGSLMEHHDWMRAEEERFLAVPASVFERWNDVFAEIARSLGLDYFGIDCGRTRDGDVLIFECNAGMLVHCRDDFAMFGYKYRYVPRIFDAFERLLDDRAANHPSFVKPSVLHRSDPTPL
jgi:glutathione synthase/RimK-type ligase-like ATP-grasp enzyme